MCLLIVLMEILGDVPESVVNLNYREKSMLSPIKLMSQITRKSTITTGRIGHYEMKGYVALDSNYEFASVAYGGMIGLPFQRGLRHVDLDRVKAAYVDLCRTNTLLSQYVLDMEKAKETVEYHVREHQKYINLEGWRDNMLLPTESVAPMAAQVPFNSLVAGK